MTQGGKAGAALRKEGQMEQIRDELEYCQLSDLGYRGPKYSWKNGRDIENFTNGRLDRAVANQSWCSVFSLAVVNVLVGRSSDHKPILVQASKVNEARVAYKKLFKIESSCMVDDDYHQIVSQAFEEGGLEGSRMQQVKQKLENCQNNLTRWSSSKFGNADRKLKQKTKQLESLQRDEGPHNWEPRKILQFKIDFILEQEDLQWEQHAKQNWY